MADHGKTATCCIRASESEIATDPGAYDCSTCELTQQFDGLWPENAEAWDLFNQLCGRTVREGRLEGWLLERWTTDWPMDRILGLFDRLDLIANVLTPHGPTKN
jgi:hypothetical protein